MQYDHIKQKQKLQSHIIVFKTGEHESVFPESMVNAVLINKKVRNSKSFTEHVPVRKVRLEVTSNGTAHDSSPWRTHLGIHRLAQSPCKKVPWDLSYCRNEPCSFDNQRLIAEENGALQHKELEEASELSMLSSSYIEQFQQREWQNHLRNVPKACSEVRHFISLDASPYFLYKMPPCRSSRCAAGEQAA